MKVALVVVLVALAGGLLFAIGGLVVKAVGGVREVFPKVVDAVGRGEPVAVVGVGAVAVLLVVLVVMWIGARPGGVHRPGHWETRGEDRHWVPDDSGPDDSGREGKGREGRG
ncbi:hypothetical protein ABZ816_03395 [Actinosynnema sp. NPDC047251]|uniref:hypothetical protein n=1 Tax=Saccharothrix espanaensis TaxID=103731 RepID=UPI0002DD85AF|nr:hypothetical protein [Saccharothrix espanaensis]